MRGIVQLVVYNYDLRTVTTDSMYKLKAILTGQDLICPFPPLIPLLNWKTDSRLFQLLFAPAHEPDQATQFVLHAASLTFEDGRIELFGDLDSLRSLHQVRDRGERGVLEEIKSVFASWLNRVGVIGVFCQIWKSEKSHGTFQVCQKFRMLSASRSQLVSRKLKRGLEVIKSDELDKPKQVKVEEKRWVGIEYLSMSAHSHVVPSSGMRDDRTTDSPHNRSV